MPAVNDEVVCIFPTNDENYCDGYVVGSLFNEKDKPNAKKQEITRTDFSDGTFIEYDLKSHTLKIECAGNIYIKGKKIYQPVVKYLAPDHHTNKDRGDIHNEANGDAPEPSKGIPLPVHFTTRLVTNLPNLPNHRQLLRPFRLFQPICEVSG